MPSHSCKHFSIPIIFRYYFYSLVFTADKQFPLCTFILAAPWLLFIIKDIKNQSFLLEVVLYSLPATWYSFSFYISFLFHYIITVYRRSTPHWHHRFPSFRWEWCYPIQLYSDFNCKCIIRISLCIIIRTDYLQFPPLQLTWLLKYSNISTWSTSVRIMTQLQAIPTEVLLHIAKVH